MADEGRFVDVTAALSLSAADTEPWPWWGAAWADYDNDGWLDAAVTRISGSMLLLHNLRDGTFEDVASRVGVTHLVSGDHKNPVWFDYDNDNDQDLFFASLHDPALYENLGDGTFARRDGVIEAPSDDAGDTGAWIFAAAAADFDQNGYEDLYAGRWDRQDVVFFNNGDGTFTRRGREVGIDTLLTRRLDYTARFENTMGLAVVDLFDDGYPDVSIGTGDPWRADRDVLLCNDGAGGFERCTDVLFAPEDTHFHTRGHGVAQVDFDHDGDGDIFVHLGGHAPFDLDAGWDSREQSRFFRRDAATPAPTAILQLEGRTSNREAVGARIEVRGQRVSHYFRHSNQGFQSAPGREVIVHLGAVSSAEVRVFWPSGSSSTTHVSPGDRVTIEEPPP